MKNSHQLPADFNPWKTVAALKGIATALEWFVTEGPGADYPPTRDAQITLNGLVHASRLFADQIYAYLEKLEEHGIELPRLGQNPDKDEVREPAPPHFVN